MNMEANLRSALADPFELRLAKARGQVDALTPSLPPSPGCGGTGLARASASQLVPQNSIELAEIVGTNQIEP